MTEAPDEVAVKTLDAHESGTDEKEGEKSSLQVSGTEPLGDAPKEAVQHPLENGSEQQEGKPDVTVNAEKNEDGQTSVPAPSGIEEQKEEDLTNSLVKEEGDGISADEASVPTEESKALSESKVPDSESLPLSHVEQEIIPEGTDSSKSIATDAEGLDKEFPSESVDAAATTKEVVQEADKPDDSAEKSTSEAPNTVIPDEPTATLEPLSSEATLQDSDKAVPSSDVDEIEPPVVTADEHIPAPAETGEEGSKGELVTDTAAVDKDLLRSKDEAEDVHVTDTGAREEETDRDRANDTIATEESSAVGSTEPTAATGTDEEEIKHEESPVEDAATVDKDTVAEYVTDEVAESTPPEVENEESASVVEPHETAPVERTKDEEDTESKADKEELPAQAEPVGVQDKDLQEAGEQASEESAPEEDPNQSTGLFESVGDKVISIGSGVLASAKGLVGLGTPGTDTETGGEAPKDSTDSKSVEDEVDITKTGHEKDSADPEAVDETGIAETKPRETGKVDESGKPTVQHAEKEFPAVDEVPQNVTGSDETQEHLSTSASNDSVVDNEEETESKEGAPVPSAATSQTEEVSSSKPVDEPIVKPVDDSQAVPTEQESSGELENLTAVSPEAVTTEHSGSEGVTEREESAPEEDPNQSTGLFESVGDKAISIGSGVLATAKGLVGLGAPVPSGVQPATSQTEEVSSSKPVDEPIVKPVDDSQAVPTEQESSGELENLTAVSPEAVTTEQSGSEGVTEREESAPEEDPNQSTGLFESVGDKAISIGSGVLASAKGLGGLGAPVPPGVQPATSQTEEVSSSKPVDEPIVKPVDDSQAVPTEQESSGELENLTAVSPEAVTTEHSGSEGVTERSFRVGVPDREESAPEEDPNQSTGLFESVGDKAISIGSGVLASAKGLVGLGAPVPSEVQPATSQTEEVSSSKPVDEPIVKPVDDSQAVPTEQESSGELENLTAVSPEAVTTEHSGSEGVTERSFRVGVPDREALKKHVEESVSGPLTPRTPGGTPLIQRVEQLEKKLAQFEEKQNSPKSQTSSASTPRSSVDRPSRLARRTLEETLSKGSLLARVAALETKLDHAFHVSSNQEVSSGASVDDEGPATDQSESTKNGTPAEDVKAPLKPLKLEFDRVTTPESGDEPQRSATEEPVDSKGSSACEEPTSANTEAVENLAEPESKEKSGAVENPAQLNSAEDSKPADVGYVKGPEEPTEKKVAEDLKSLAPTTTTAEDGAQEPAQTRELPAAATNISPAKKGKTEGPVSKIKARLKGCFVGGGKKSAV